MDLQHFMLALGAVIFAGFGVWLIIAPQALRAVDIGADSPNARAELRAMYGGLELAIALVLLYCLRRPDLVEDGLELQFVLITGIAAGRLLGIVLERFRVSKLLYFFLTIETAGAIFTCMALRH